MRRAGRCSAPLRRSGFVCCPSADYRNLEQLFSPSPRGDTEQLEAAFWGDYNTPRGRSGGKKKLKSKGLNDLERQRSPAAVLNARSAQQCGAAPARSCRAHGAARVFCYYYYYFNWSFVFLALPVSLRPLFLPFAFSAIYLPANRAL